MYKFLLRPKWIAFHLLVAALVIVMINLGFWQIRRLHQREAFNTLVRNNTNQPVVPISSVLTSGVDTGAVEWRRVEVTGTYLPAKEITVVNRSQGGDAGRNVVDPLRLADGSLLLVNRGFVPGLQAIPAAPTGQVTLMGQLRDSEVRRLGQPSDASGVLLTEVRRIDISKLTPQMGAPVAPMYLQLLASNPPQGDIPQAVEPPELDNGPHLSYAVQWFVFSTFALVGWVMAVRYSVATRSGKPRKKRRTPPPIADELSRV